MKKEEMTMSSPQESGSTSPGDEGQLEDAVAAFSDAVFEAT
jgi:hypothetical protein